jgi:hypothetical protein
VTVFIPRIAATCFRVPCFLLRLGGGGLFSSASRRTDCADDRDVNMALYACKVLDVSWIHRMNRSDLE